MIVLGNIPSSPRLQLCAVVVPTASDFLCVPLLLRSSVTPSFSLRKTILDSPSHLLPLVFKKTPQNNQEPPLVSALESLIRQHAK